jgi:hypothetical protein
MSEAHAPPSDDAQHAEPTHAEQSGEAAHAHAKGPQLPTVVDEAGDSPKWLPWLGIGLFFLIAVLVAGRRVLPEAAGAEDAAAEEPTAAEQAGVEGAKPAGEPPAKPAAD